MSERVGTVAPVGRLDRLAQLPLLAPLQVRDYRLVWFGESVSLLGDQFHYVALAWLVLQLTGSGLALGTVLLASSLPRGAFLLFGGVLADRVSQAAPFACPNPYHSAMTRPNSLPFTGNDEADHLLVDEPLALLVGFALDQQVTVQKAFSGPAELKRRLGHLDAARIAAMDPAVLDAVFRERPALHRFPGSMAGKVQALCAAIAADHGNDAARVWTEAEDGPALEARLLALPGIGEMKAKSIIAVLGKRFGIRPPGYEAVAPSWPTLGDVDSSEALAAYQAGKRAHKAALRAEGG
jgi:uncharacterized HhH-GPD family protein